MLKVTPFSLVTDVSTGTATDVAPTLSTDGMALLKVRAYTVTVSAAAGQVLTGAGNMLCYRYSDALARWTRNPDLDFPITPNNGQAWVNMRDRACSEFTMLDYFGRMKWIPSGVAVDGGANVTTTIEAAQES